MDTFDKPSIQFTVKKVISTVEGFVPDADIETVRPWLERGVCNHVAVKLEGSVDFLKIRQALLQSGFFQPSFSNPVGAYIVTEDKTITYFDFLINGKSMRLEICLDGNQVSASNRNLK